MNVLYLRRTFLVLCRYNDQYQYPKMKGYGDNSKIFFKEWELLYIYRFTNTY
jgi:hypothetical protein